MWNKFSTGANAFAHISIAPLALNMDMPTIIATKYGIIFIATLKPSFAPSVNSSYTGTFFIKPIVKISIKRTGKAHNEIKLRKLLIFTSFYFFCLRFPKFLEYF